jgi:hypothetical protein
MPITHLNTMIMKATTPMQAATLAQVTNNTTRWIGHRKADNKDVASGQTFVANKEGTVQSIEVFSSMVTQPGDVTMTLHSFDPDKKSWGPAMSKSCVEFNGSNSGQWIAFDMDAKLDKGMCYGFKLECDKAFVGVGEAAGSHDAPPYSTGQEWEFTNTNQNGCSYNYFSLAFKVGMSG